MRNITNTIELRNAIQLLEVEHAIKGQLLRKEIYAALSSLKPSGLIKSTLSEAASPSFLIDTAVGLATGFVFKKIAVGVSGKILKSLLGSLLQFGIQHVISKKN